MPLRSEGRRPIEQTLTTHEGTVIAKIVALSLERAELERCRETAVCECADRNEALAADEWTVVKVKLGGIKIEWGS